jgi:hypothetical protein
MSNINEIAQQVKQATDYQINKRILREKILVDLHLPYNGGMFKITMDLLAFLSTWPDDDLFLEDVYQNPIKINRTEFLTLARQQYYSVMNTWHQQHNELKNIRKV